MNWQELQLDNGRIAVRLNTLDPTRKSLIFIHGLGGSCSAWNALSESCSTCNCVQIDLRGHGFSHRYSQLDDYRLESLAQDVAQVVRSLNVQNPCLIAHSFGCFVALTCLAERYFPIDRLVLLAPGAPRRHRYSARLLSWLLRNQQHYRPGYSGKRLDYRRYPRNTDYDIARMAGDIRATGLRVYLSCLHWLFFADINKLVKYIDIPALLIHGTQDQVFSLAHAQHIADQLPQAQLCVIENAGHLLPLTHPTQLAEILQAHHIVECL